MLKSVMGRNSIPTPASLQSPTMRGAIAIVAILVLSGSARHYARRDEIGYWAWIEFPWGDGPMVGRVAPLPAARNGHPRFYVDGEGAAAAGGTYRKQIGIWEWDGRAATPLFLRSYSTSV